MARRVGHKGLATLLTWQKLAPLCLILFLPINLYTVSLVNALLGALMMMSAVSLPALLVFSGLVQIGWVLRLGGGTLIWYYLAMYYLGLLAVIVYQRESTVPFALALLNAGGLPPMTGFMIKLRALGALPAMRGVVLLTARGAALTSYVRLLLASKLR